MNDPNILSWHTPRRMKVCSLTSATMRTTSVPGSYPAHPSSPGQHHAWFPLNQEMCFDFALIFQVSPTFMPAGKHAAGPVEWLEGHVLTMCLRVTFQALRDGFSPWQHHLLLILPPSGKDIRSWNLIWFFFSIWGWVSPVFLPLSLSGQMYTDSRFLLCSWTWQVKKKSYRECTGWCFLHVSCMCRLSSAPNSWLWRSQGPERALRTLQAPLTADKTQILISSEEVRAFYAQLCILWWWRIQTIPDCFPLGIGLMLLGCCCPLYIEWHQQQKDRLLARFWNAMSKIASKSYWFFITYL